MDNDIQQARAHLDGVRRSLLRIERRAAQGQGTDVEWARVEAHLRAMLEIAWDGGFEQRRSRQEFVRGVVDGWLE